MFENLKYLYEKNLLDQAGLERAVALGWISGAEKEQIIGGKNNESMY